MRHAILAAALLFADECSCQQPPSSDTVKQVQQEAILKDAAASVGMPAIKNYRELRLMKLILEQRDQNDLATFTYLWSDYQGKLVFFCNSIGYGLPYATQFTNPQKLEISGGYYRGILPQADPNGLFSPAAADGTWVLCKDPKGPDVKPVYVEPRSVVSPFELISTPEPKK